MRVTEENKNGLTEQKRHLPRRQRPTVASNSNMGTLIRNKEREKAAGDFFAEGQRLRKSSAHDHVDKGSQLRQRERISQKGKSKDANKRGETTGKRCNPGGG